MSAGRFVWLGNLMHYGLCVDTAQESLLNSLAIVPDNAMARAFRDHAGRLNQAIAGGAKRVYFTVAGLLVILKGKRG